MFEDDYYSLLLRTITAARHDPTQLRTVIYQFARSELRRQLYAKRDFSWPDLKKHISALETAIEQIEADVDDNILCLPGLSQSEPTKQLGATTHNAIMKPVATELVPQEPFSAFERSIARAASHIQYDAAQHQPRPTPAVDSIITAFWSGARLVAAVILGVALFTVMENHGSQFSLLTRHGNDDGIMARADGHSSQSAMEPAAPPSALLPSPDPQLKNIPIPGAYGVYAVDHDKLTDLQSLPIKVPDQRVGISALFSGPSASTLPDGQLQFIAFRRDLANDAPDRVLVRVVGRVMHELTFDATGNAKLINVDASWAVRSNAYPMKVEPVASKPEMIIIRPENPSFSFPAGRYALVLQGSAYDFSVAGPITDTAQCLQRTDALNMPVYTECRTP